jgi:thymidine kinase
MATYGTLEIITGPMFSNKTTELTRRLCIYSTIGSKVLYVNSDKDTRTDTVISTHNKLLNTSPCQLEMKLTKTKLLADINWKDYNVIGIDEAQFFDDLFKVVTEQMLPAGKIVIVAGLDGDKDKKPFGDLLFLIPFSKDCKKLNAKCLMCAKEGIDKNGIPNDVDAPFTKLIISNPIQKPGKDGQTLVGGKGTYMAVCDHHHHS